MNKRQLKSAWIFAVLWAVTVITVVYGAESYESGSTTFLKALAATAVWGVFATLRHISLKEKQ